jgi:Zn-dependent protease
MTHINIGMFLITLIAVLPSLTIHEFAHGWMAYKFGDNTAKNMGRLTLNPIAHIDPFGTLLLPLLIQFGYAKPVPVNFSVLSRLQILLVAIAGPISNILLALVLTAVYHLFVLLNVHILPVIGQFLLMGILLNFMFAVFNLIPIPPLDGSRVVYASLKSPEAIRIYSHFSQFGMIIIFGLVYLSWSGRFDVFGRIIDPVITFIFNLLHLPLIY